MSRLVAVGVVALLSVSSSILLASGGGVVAAVAGDDSVVDPAVRAEVTRVERSTLRYEVRVTEFGDAASATIAVGEGADVVRASGFRTVPGGELARFRWSGDAGTATLVFETDAAVADRPPSAPDAGTAGAWTLARIPPVVLRWSPGAGGGTNEVWPLRDGGASVRVDRPVVLCDRYAFVGVHEERTRVVEGERIRLVVPAGTDTRPERERIADALATAARSLEVGDRSDEVRLFALPDPARAGGEAFPVHDEGWVHADSPLDDPDNVWLHEYVHTRQAFALGSGMAWFREASAEYYAAELTHEQGRIDRATLRGHLAHPDVNASLTRRATWPDDRVPYTRGAHALALLDRTLRRTTGGQRSLEDVFRRMNEYDGVVTYGVFADIVAGVAGHRLDPWLDRYVRGDARLPTGFDRAGAGGNRRPGGQPPPRNGSGAAVPSAPGTGGGV